jgi:2-C-methyl-D-erythritol 4-phosphate cytidylyltransferase
MKIDAVIVSAGKGQRFNQGTKKQFLALGGKPILARAIDPFEASPLIRSIYLVVAPEDMDYCRSAIVEEYRYGKIARIVAGGTTRQQSAKNGLDAVPGDCEIISIHDGVRPFVTNQMIEDSVRGALRFGAVVVGVPVKDTIKHVSTDGTVLRTLDREPLWQIQTPQTFQTALIRDAHNRALAEGVAATDDASLVERLGTEVHVLPGSYSNIKITTPEDAALAEYLIQQGNVSSGGAFPPAGTPCGNRSKDR